MNLQPTRIPKLLALAKGRPCVRCGNRDGTTVGAHYQGCRSHAYGKGRGIKPHDAMVAHLCNLCHCEADSSGLGDTPERHSARFLLLIIATQLQLWVEDRITGSDSVRQLMMDLCGHSSELMDAGEDELHRTAMRLAEAWTAGEIRISAGGAMVGDYVEVDCAGR